MQQGIIWKWVAIHATNYATYHITDERVDFQPIKHQYKDRHLFEHKKKTGKVNNNNTQTVDTVPYTGNNEDFSLNTTPVEIESMKHEVSRQHKC